MKESKSRPIVGQVISFEGIDEYGFPVYKVRVGKKINLRGPLIEITKGFEDVEE